MSLPFVISGRRTEGGVTVDIAATCPLCGQVYTIIYSLDDRLPKVEATKRIRTRLISEFQFHLEDCYCDRIDMDSLEGEEP